MKTTSSQTMTINMKTVALAHELFEAQVNPECPHDRCSTGIWTDPKEAVWTCDACKTVVNLPPPIPTRRPSAGGISS